MAAAITAFIDAYSAGIGLLVLAAVFAGFVSEWRPPEVIAGAGAAAFLILGVVDTDAAIGALANSAPVTIAAMFIISGALLRTGLLDAASRKLASIAGRSPRTAMGSMFAGGTVASAFMNNTPVVMVMVPIVRRLARQIGKSPSKFLIPISYAAILGGTCTLIGTSTNLLVDGVAQDLGMAPFSMFEITGMGLLIALIAGLFLALAGSRLLPERASLSDLLEKDKKPRFIAEVVVPMESPLIGLALEEVSAFRNPDVTVIDLLRNGASRRYSLKTLTLEAGDRVLIETPASELMGIRESGKLSVGGREALQPLSARELVVVEALVGPGRGLLGRALRELDLPTRFSVFPLAIHRRGRNIGAAFEEEKLQVGDTILLEGSPEAVARLATRFDLLGLAESSERPFRRKRAPVALGVIAAIVLLASFDVLPIAALAMIGAAVVMLTRCIDVEEAMSSIDGRILVLIFAMLIIGAGLEAAGSVEMIVGWVTPALRDAPPWLLLACVYALTSILTETVTNNAVAVIVTPVAASLALDLGIDPRPLVVAVMFAASASFATPIGYQTNTIVYMAGGYRFSDFLKVGLPMNVIVGAATVFLIPMFWPMT